MKPEYMEELAIILGSSGNDKSVVGGSLLCLVEKAKEDNQHIDVLEVALVKKDRFPSTKRPLSTEPLATSRWDELNQYHLPIILSHLKLAFVTSETATMFAKKCYDVINMFESNDERVFTLSSILYSPFIPYRQIVGTFKSVSEKEYNDLLVANREFAEDLVYVERLPFEDLSSECLNVLNVLNKTNDDKLKVALLALYVSNIIRRYKKSSSD